ncbi:hypothetical protein BGX21_002378, partial [Mortierella sp. AD011]
MTTTKPIMSSKTAQEDPAVEALRKEQAAVKLDLRNTKQNLLDAEDDLESSQADLSAALSSLAERDIELGNTKITLANSEHARLNAERVCLEANRGRVLSRPHGKQEVFVVLKFREPQPLPVGGYRLFALQRKAVK